MRFGHKMEERGLILFAFGVILFVLAIGYKFDWVWGLIVAAIAIMAQGILLISIGLEG